MTVACCINSVINLGWGECRSALSMEVSPPPPQKERFYLPEGDPPGVAKVIMVSALQQDPCSADGGDELHYLSVRNKQARHHPLAFQKECFIALPLTYSSSFLLWLLVVACGCLQSQGQCTLVGFREGHVQDYARLHGMEFVLGMEQADPRLENMWNKPGESLMLHLQEHHNRSPLLSSRLQSLCADHQCWIILS